MLHCNGIDPFVTLWAILIGDPFHVTTSFLRVRSFRPNFGGSFRSTLFYIDFFGNNFFLASLIDFYAVISDIKFFWLPRFISCSFIDNKGFFLICLYFLANFIDLI